VACHSVLFVPLAVLRLPEVLVVWEHRFRRKDSRPMPALVDTTWLPFLLPAIGFVALYSFLGHKETRFLFPVMPLFNLAAAVGMSRIHRTAFPPASKDKMVPTIARLAYVCGVLAMLGSLLGTVLYIQISKHNYPGGEILRLLVDRIATETSQHHQQHALEAKVYVDVAAAMTGVSLFGQRAAQQRTPWVTWTFDKGGYEPENQLPTGGETNWSEYTHILTENRELATGHTEFVPVEIAKGNPRLTLSGGIELDDSMFLLERTGWTDNR